MNLKLQRNIKFDGRLKTYNLIHILCFVPNEDSKGTDLSLLKIQWILSKCSFDAHFECLKWRIKVFYDILMRSYIVLKAGIVRDMFIAETKQKPEIIMRFIIK